MAEETELKKREVLRMSNEESHQLTLECIRSALIILMKDKPYEKITITEIIKKSGVSRAAFYRNYSSKEEVLKEAMDEIRKKLQEFFSNVLNNENPEKWLIQLFDEIKINRRELEILLNANLDYEKIFEELVFDEQPDNPMYLYRMAMYMSSLWSVVKLWLEGGCNEKAKDLVNLIMETFVINSSCASS